MDKIGFVLDDIGPTQLLYILSNSINEYYKTLWDTNLSVFMIDIAPPCMEMNFATFYASDAATFDGLLVATSYKSWKAIQKSVAKKVLYVNFLEKQDKNSSEYSSWIDIIKDNQIIKVWRAKEYLDFYKKIFPEIIHETVIQDLEAKEIINLWQNLQKNQ